MESGATMNRILENSIFRDKRYSPLLEALEQAKDEMDSAYTNLSNALEPELIDSYIYQLQSVQMRYKFLLSRVKQIEDSYAKNPLDISGS